MEELIQAGGLALPDGKFKREDSLAVLDKKRKLDDDEVIEDVVGSCQEQDVGLDSGDNNSRTISETKAKTPCFSFKKRGKCKYGKKCHFLHDAEDFIAKKCKTGLNQNKGVHQDSLFGKLVKEEIKFEDNILLQCFRHFVEASFFNLET